jgi:hypothetical protein
MGRGFYYGQAGRRLRLQKLSCRVRVADGGLFVDADNEQMVDLQDPAGALQLAGTLTNPRYRYGA